MIYSITKGVLATDDGEVILDGCYAGGDLGLRPDAVNNPAFCQFHNVGPLPPGKYAIGSLTKYAGLGLALVLTPDPANQMFGRNGFYIHYKNSARDAGLAPYPPRAGRNSSDGCVVSIKPGALLGVEARRAAGDGYLTVTA